MKSYTSIRAVEKVIYAIDDFQSPFPVTFNQIAWLTLSLLFVIVFAHVLLPSMMEEASLKYSDTPVAVTWFMSQRTPDDKKPPEFLRPFISYHLRSKATFVGKRVKEQEKRWDEPSTLVGSMNYVFD